MAVSRRLRSERTGPPQERRFCVNMIFYKILFLGLCIATQAHPEAHEYEQSHHGHHGSWVRKRFAEIGGMRADPSLRMLWHVGVYSKGYTPYMQICGGTLVTKKAVISAAHCFWSDAEGALPATLFAVGAGKLFRPWNDPQDVYSQKSDVAAIHIPVRYRDLATNYQEDIAVVMVAEEFTINEVALRPACVNFDEEFDDDQLEPGNRGTILGWGLTEEDGPPSQVLNYLKLPAVDIEKCMTSVDAGFLRYITSDKICAGVTTGQALCRGDSGGGLVFSEQTGATRAHYLRGVASTAPRNEHRCNAHALAALTHVRAHRAFLRRHIPGLEDECEQHYPNANKHRKLLSSIGSIGERTAEPATEKPTKIEKYKNCFCKIQVCFAEGSSDRNGIQSNCTNSLY